MYPFPVDHPQTAVEGDLHDDSLSNNGSLDCPTNEIIPPSPICSLPQNNKTSALSTQTKRSHPFHLKSPPYPSRKRSCLTNRYAKAVIIRCDLPSDSTCSPSSSSPFSVSPSPSLCLPPSPSLVSSNLDSTPLPCDSSLLPLVHPLINPSTCSSPPTSPLFPPSQSHRHINAVDRSPSPPQGYPSRLQKYSDSSNESLIIINPHDPSSNVSLPPLLTTSHSNYSSPLLQTFERSTRLKSLNGLRSGESPTTSTGLFPSPSPVMLLKTSFKDEFDLAFHSSRPVNPPPSSSPFKSSSPTLSTTLSLSNSSHCMLDFSTYLPNELLDIVMNFIDVKTLGTIQCLSSKLREAVQRVARRKRNVKLYSGDLSIVGIHLLPLPKERIDIWEAPNDVPQMLPQSVMHGRCNSMMFVSYDDGDNSDFIGKEELEGWRRKKKLLNETKFMDDCDVCPYHIYPSQNHLEDDNKKDGIYQIKQDLYREPESPPSYLQSLSSQNLVSDEFQNLETPYPTNCINDLESTQVFDKSLVSHNLMSQNRSNGLLPSPMFRAFGDVEPLSKGRIIVGGGYGMFEMWDRNIPMRCNEIWDFDIETQDWRLHSGMTEHDVMENDRLRFEERDAISFHVREDKNEDRSTNRNIQLEVHCRKYSANEDGRWMNDINLENNNAGISDPTGFTELPDSSSSHSKIISGLPSLSVPPVPLKHPVIRTIVFGQAVNSCYHIFDRISVTDLGPYDNPKSLRRTSYPNNNNIGDLCAGNGVGSSSSPLIRYGQPPTSHRIEVLEPFETAERFGLADWYHFTPISCGPDVPLPDKRECFSCCTFRFPSPSSSGVVLLYGGFGPGMRSIEELYALEIPSIFFSGSIKDIHQTSKSIKSADNSNRFKWHFIHNSSTLRKIPASGFSKRYLSFPPLSSILDECVFTSDEMIGDSSSFAVSSETSKDVSSPSGPVGRFGHSMVLIGQRVFLFGGKSDVCTKVQKNNNNKRFSSRSSSAVLGDLWILSKLPPPAPTSVPSCWSISPSRATWKDEGEVGSRRAKLRALQAAEDLKPLSPLTFSSLSIGDHKWEGKTKNCEMEIGRGWFWFQPKCTGTPPSARSSHRCVGVGSHLIVFGGFAINRYVNDFHLLHTGSFVWTSLDLSPKLRELLLSTNEYKKFENSQLKTINKNKLNSSFILKPHASVRPFPGRSSRCRAISDRHNYLNDDTAPASSEISSKVSSVGRYEFRTNPRKLIRHEYYPPRRLVSSPTCSDSLDEGSSHKLKSSFNSRPHLNPLNDISINSEESNCSNVQTPDKSSRKSSNENDYICHQLSRLPKNHLSPINPLSAFLTPRMEPTMVYDGRRKIYIFGGSNRFRWDCKTLRFSDFCGDLLVLDIGIK